MHQPTSTHFPFREVVGVMKISNEGERKQQFETSRLVINFTVITSDSINFPHLSVKSAGFKAS